MFFTDPDYWTAALVLQRHGWYRGGRLPDRSYVINLLDRNTWPNHVWGMAGAYRVARNFPIGVRPQAVEIIRSAQIGSFDTFVSEVRRCAQEIQAIPRDGARAASYPISGVSKILWHRFPTHGFIFDEQVRLALSNSGLCAAFYHHLDVWGGPAREGAAGDRDFLTFAAGYQKFCMPMFEAVGEYIELQPGGDVMPAEIDISIIRVLDKLMWLAGEEALRRDAHLERWNAAATPDEVDAGRVLAIAGQALLDAFANDGG